MKRGKGLVEARARRAERDDRAVQAAQAGWPCAAVSLGLLLAGPGAAAQTAVARVRPPIEATCPPDHLTMYGGQVLRYQRGPDRTALGIRTDWGTDEAVTIQHPGAGDPARWFLVERQPFRAVDWARIEQRPGQLHPGMRAAAWLCDDGRHPVVDWQPPRKP